MIICTGSIALDTTRTPFKTMERELGGAASFFSYCSSFFVSTNIVGIVGEDFPEKHWTLLKGKGIGLDGVQRKGKTFFVDWTYGYELYDRKVNKLELNCLEGFEPKVPDAWKKAEYVYLGTAPPEQQIRVLEQVDAPKFSLLDTIEHYVQNDRSALKKALGMVDGVLVNEGEARRYAKTPNLMKAARVILDEGPKIVIIKKGEHGALLFTEGTVFPSPAYPLDEVVDPTGAGDSFAGGFMGFIAKQRNTKRATLKSAMAYGHAFGSIAVEDYGLKSLINTEKDDIESRFKVYKKIIAFEGD
ncbi:sugar kinase [Candidatus Micrarchaeota archaeon]|nr:sugar kinase [Candidatus Micrarchaeota archaeon]